MEPKNYQNQTKGLEFINLWQGTGSPCSNPKPINQQIEAPQPLEMDKQRFPCKRTAHERRQLMEVLQECGMKGITDESLNQIGPLNYLGLPKNLPVRQPGNWQLAPSVRKRDRKAEEKGVEGMGR